MGRGGGEMGGVCSEDARQSMGSPHDNKFLNESPHGQDVPVGQSPAVRNAIPAAREGCERESI
jgi:hypothetical protein